MDKRLFSEFCRIAYDRAGIRIREGKECLVAARVAKRLRALKISSAGEYLHFLENDASGEELVQFLDVITTNFTRFFREPDHFDDLSDYVLDGIGRGQRRFRFWCAASSSGEEPYSILITLREALAGQDADVRLLATDISTRMLEAARAGRYKDHVVEPVPPRLRKKYFEDCPQTGDLSVTEELRRLVVFKRLNLSTPPFPMRGPLDVVFCRNVMIYFDRPVRQLLISAIEELLAPGGLLIIGHTETLTGLRTELKVVRPSVYRKAGGDHVRKEGAR